MPKEGDAVKKPLAFLLFMTVFLAACSNPCRFEVGEPLSRIRGQYTPCIVMNALSAYRDGGACRVIIEDGGTIQKLAEFSADRTVCRTQGLDLVERGDIARFLHIGWDELTEMLGPPHADIGSGFSIPAYVTEDAYLMSFGREDGVVTEVTLRDLLRGGIAERVGREETPASENG